ncbi:MULTISPECIES: hypothetical protein [Cutibacterium]|jgi:hypothetical protein|uniref:Uncharacterized protein n=3 Tax=Cutibacterium acnes TaxID=1747 RepID=A0A1G9GXE6_CUTAC|nr:MULTISPECIES: hypothetical protein [Cutibacterium]EGL39686.1 hypothetical protein HMPREF9948_0607 [Propionibacterium sp. 434-HC2]EGL45417.1 hypothetical protein HMPREF9947_1285 [Propionibacterium sp. 409-HC1]EGR91652.1 hypothetical protein HMPREF9949_0442 [Propionibacterium sp. CC003-HC2]ERS19387.1 hypothetical protein HMPREF1303_02305 [Propionibacterium sp. KPL2009]ERS22798.1 hypothetical protein HMPREF1302_02369 [Propionibacterium sp. KPL2008]ERS29099.1 hypothetical protein HMPREF1299_02|tara:strand:- start:986 stop:1240 length:255 start_codon:yes stop_codon:yes gene_type:complete
MSALFVTTRKLGVMVNRAYLSLSVLALVLWVAAYRHLPGWAAGITLACIVLFSLFCEWSRVRTLARIGKSRGTAAQSSRGRKLS